MRKLEEFSIGGKSFRIELSGRGSGVIMTDDFAATLRELENLYLFSSGYMTKQIAQEYHLKNDTIKNSLNDLRKRNEDLTGRFQTTVELAVKADQYELLNFYALKGAYKVLERLRVE